MKRYIFITLLVIAGLSLSCSSNKNSDDPIAQITELSQEISKSGDDWTDEQWNEAAAKLQKALSNLPSPLETKEERDLETALDRIERVASDHQRKAAKMISVLEAFNSKNTKGEEGTLNGHHELSGTIGDIPATMNLDITDNVVKGTYYYRKSGTTGHLVLLGSNNNGIIDMSETDEKGVPTGHFKGRMESGVFKGVFVNNRGQKFPFTFSEGGADPNSVSFSSSEFNDVEFDYGESDAYIEDDWDDNDDMSSSNSGGSASVDELLDAYEKYSNDYIKYMKRAVNGDMSALQEYPKLLEDAQVYGDKLEKCRDMMTPAQWKRYSKITTRMLEEAQKIQL